MKKLFLVLSIFLFFTCHQSANETETLAHKIDSLQTKVDNVYRPGLGEFMSAIQLHHAKLWFAGKNSNWKLADFELSEIKEIFADIKTYCSERKETQMISMIYPALDSVNSAAQNQNISAFTQGFKFLTKTCNNCHQAVNYQFNRIKIPERAPIGNQDFKQVN